MSDSAPPPPVIEPPPQAECERPVPLAARGGRPARRGGRWLVVLAVLLVLSGIGVAVTPLVRKELERRAGERELVRLQNQAADRLLAGDPDGAEAAAREALSRREDFEPARKVLASATALRKRMADKAREGRSALAAAEKWLEEDDIVRALAAFGRIRANKELYGAEAVNQAIRRHAELSTITGTLRLPENWPADVSIMVNGRQVKPADGRIEGLPLDTIRVGLVREGYRSQPVAKIAIRGGRPVTLPGPEWELLPGRVSLTSKPPGAAVWVDGADTGRVTPCEIPDADAGPVEVVLKLPSYADAVVKGEVPSGGKINLTAELSELPVLPTNGTTAGERRVFNVSPTARIPFRWCPPGSFVMGTAGTGGAPDERPARKVEISAGFWLGETEFTQAQWESVMGRDSLLGLLHAGAGSLPAEPAAPMAKVSWDRLCDGVLLDKANAYLTDNQATGWVADLPTEAQWEYACRAGGAAPTDAQNDSEAGPAVWFRETSGGKYRITGVGKANAWGLRDMCGNVGEWCRDAYQENYGNLWDRDPGGPVSGWKRVFRGGSFLSAAERCRPAARGQADSAVAHPGIGFRLMLRPQTMPPVLGGPPPPAKPPAGK